MYICIDEMCRDAFPALPLNAERKSVNLCREFVYMYMGVWCGRRPAAGKAERKEEVRPRGAKKRAKDRVRKRERE